MIFDHSRCGKHCRLAPWAEKPADRWRCDLWDLQMELRAHVDAKSAGNTPPQASEQGARLIAWYDNQLQG